MASTLPGSVRTAWAVVGLNMRDLGTARAVAVVELRDAGDGDGLGAGLRQHRDRSPTANVAGLGASWRR